MSYYDGLKAEVVELLTELGKPIAFNRAASGGAYDPATGVITGGAPLTLNGVGVLCRYTSAEIDGVNIVASDRKMVYSGDAVEVGDTYSTARVMHVGPVDPDESGAIVYVIQLRG